METIGNEQPNGYQEVVAALSEPRTPSQRGLELLQLMADGRTDNEIADALSISAKTIRSRQHALRMKMQARSRTHAVAIAFRRGLLQVERRARPN
jgi:DNA-binding NarL/FixJ family response regulator